jgi:YD repeat-containing protein
VTSKSFVSYTYDANGNTLSDASGKSYSWDFNNRLTQAIVPNVGTTTFRYDPFGRRIQKSGPLGTTNFLYDGANLLEEIDNITAETCWPDTRKTAISIRHCQNFEVARQATTRQTRRWVRLRRSATALVRLPVPTPTTVTGI